MAEFVDVMPDREKVIKCLEMCVSNSLECSLQCPYAAPVSGFCYDDLMRDALALLKAQEPVVPHRNYQYLSDYWCECGWHLGRGGSVKYCPECGRAVKWE